ncbi:MAG: apolipoprotein N-acyltransferase [Pseudomonadota bacterium]
MFHILHRWWFLILAGAVGALAMPPFYIVPALTVPFTVLFLALRDATTGRQAFWRAAYVGFGYHLAGLYWVANALLVPGNPYIWAYPLALLFLPMLFAAYFGCVGLLYRRFRLKYPDAVLWQEWLYLSALLGAMEYLRAFLFSGFPWNLPAYTWIGLLPVAQSLALIGPYGLSLLTLLVATLPVLFVLKHRTAATAAAALALILAIVFAGGVWRLIASQTNSLATPALPVTVHIVQPNISQAEKWDSALYGQHLKTLLTLSAAAPGQAETGRHVLLWPETAVNGRMLGTTEAIASVKGMLAGYGAGRATLLTGMLRVENNRETGKDAYYNSMIAWNDRLDTLDYFDKAHLVPFGEYMPFEDYIPLGPIVGFSGFAAGPGPRTLRLGNGIPPFSALVCYEVIFPGQIVDETDRPTWLANSTNDSWYGRSTGPYQHLAITRARAIEEGLPAARAANTGISAMIDPYGRIQAAQPLNTIGVLRVTLPLALPATPYTQHRNLFFFTSLIVMYMFATRIQVKKKIDANAA